MLLLGTKPPLVHYPDFIVCLASEKLFVTDFKDLYVSLFLEKNSPIVISQEAYQALGTCFHLGFLRFTPTLFNYTRNPSTWDLQFSSASHLGVSTRK
jgi:hypothetical protein